MTVLSGELECSLWNATQIAAKVIRSLLDHHRIAMTTELAAHAATLPPAPPFDTPAEHMQAVFDAQLPKALSLRSSTATERIAKIKALREAMLAEREAIYAALAQDMRKSKAEVEASELLPVLDEMRHAIGVAVFSGMLGVTFFGIFFTPVFYVLFRTLALRLRGTQKAA